MEVIDYVEKFKLDQENYEFKREEFISKLGKDFLETCQETTIGINPKTKIIYYYRFREIVKDFEKKFWEISNLKVGEPFTKALFNAFFATQVVPLRAKWFPNQHAYITQLRDKNLSKQDKNLSEGKNGKNRRRNNRPSR